MNHISIDIINLVPIFVDSPLIKVGFCVHVHKTTSFSTTNIHNFCKDKDTEAGALRLEFQSTKICITQIYRSTSGNLLFFSMDWNLLSRNSVKLIYIL